MAFPVNPSVDDTFEQNGVTYVWDGVAWGKQTTLLGASTVGYDNSGSGLVANTLQGAVDEVIDTTYTKDEVDTIVKSNLVSSGVINKQDDSLVFSTTVGNEYKLQDNSRFFNFDGKVVELPSGIEIDMTDNMPEVTVQYQATNGLVVQGSVNAGDYVVVDKLIKQGTAISSSTSSNSIHLQNDNNGFEVGDIVNIYSITDSTFVVANAVVQSKGIISGSNYYIQFDKIYNRVSGQDYTIQLASDVYRAKQDFPDNYNPATTPISVLDTDYFEDRTQFGITNKILATMKEDGTIKTEVCFVDTDIEHCGNAHIVMTDNGYSKLSNGLYSKDGDVVTPLGTWSTLNKGGAHPVYNYFGTKYLARDVDTGVATDYNRVWTSGTAYPVSQTSDAFTYYSDRNGYDGSVSNSQNGQAHPQNKFYDIIYPDQWIDLRISANAISEQDELNRVGTKAKSGQLDGVGGVVATYGIVNGTSTNTSSGGICYFGTTKPVWWDDRWNNTAVLGASSDAQISEWKYKAFIMIGADIYYWDGQTIVYSGHYGLRFLKLSNESNFPSAGSYDTFTITKTLPHPSSGTALRTDVIGDPANYPQDWKDRLASGLPLIGMNPLLVGQDGTDYTVNSGAIPTLMCKGYSALISQYYNGSTFEITSSAISDFILNKIQFTTNQMNVSVNTYIINYTAKIPTTQVSDPKPVKLVGNYVTATNSHSVYKGNQLVPTGKVNVGNGTNGLESRVVENSIVGSVIVLKTKDFPINTVFHIEDSSFSTRSSFNPVNGHFYKLIDYDTEAEATMDNWAFGYSSRFTDLGTSYTGSYINVPSNFIVTTPSHSTLSLDSSNSPAVKLIETIAEDDDGMAHYQVFAQEMVWDFSADIGNEFNQVVVNTTNAYTAGEYYRLAHADFGKYNNTIIRCLTSVSYTASQLQTLYLREDGVLMNPATLNTEYFKLWDGNGFGCSGKFEYLTNTTSTDDNGNTVRNIVSSTPLNKYLGK
jgi:hypothetical protein